MKLLMSPMSPFARKARIFVRELGVTGQVEEVNVTVMPISVNPDVSGRNPLGKIPVLMRDDGIALYDSPVICEYLDSLHEDRKLVPATGEARWTALRQQALADGLMDAAVLLRYETAMRPELLRWDKWIDGQQAKIDLALDALACEFKALDGDLTIGGVSTICALGYLDFRFTSYDWRSARPALASWYAVQSERESVLSTVLHA